jgi:hypothetical protein
VAHDFEGETMPATKGTMRKIADAVGDAVHAAAAGVGLVGEPEPATKSARKAAAARVAKARKAGR